MKSPNFFGFNVPCRVSALFLSLYHHGSNATGPPDVPIVNPWE